MPCCAFAIAINLSGSVDPWTAVGSRLLFLMFYVAMVRAGSIVMPAETVGPIAAKSGVTLRPSVIVSGRPMNRCPVSVEIAVMAG